MRDLKKIQLTIQDMDNYLHLVANNLISGKRALLLLMKCQYNA